MSWQPIAYRDFFDVPRAFIVEHRGSHLYFLCKFDDTVDEYATEYRVHRLAGSRAPMRDDESWDHLEQDAEFLGVVAVGDVAFDETRRRAIDDRVLQVLVR